MGPAQLHPRVKVSVTVDSTLLKIVDTFLRDHPESDRSSVFNSALLLWCREQQELAIAAQHQAPKSDAERSEQKFWYQVQAAAIDRTYSRS